MDLACPINADDIANRWLNNFVPLPGQTPKEYSPSVADFIHRMLNSLPLSTCLSVIRMCDKPLRGSEAVVAEVLQREMTKLFDQRASFDDMTLLAAFQAHLIYAMVIFFRLGREYYSYLRQAMMDAQELASALSRRGLMCSAEQHGSRPAWEAWIAAETKRRTLYTMCMFDSALLRHDGLPSHLATELRGLLAPGSKALWEAAQRREWEVRYNRHLATWNDGGLRIDELWPIPRGLCEADVARRRERVDIWLEDLDEYGTMMYAVTSCTHGG
ncbi:hypothetical protein Cob_v011728 [Colletotrichum orbiculare MAFF 240422]|uniref:C6 finger domain-containing protein n=1 Tax=Colletotrichum orbiculare (strain 104-T / ATCC 96160 / CBS 514.97 / LARS 414 / MAFF 240422) TaxID=1213857 RepID=A0A484FCG8_COLOR|nr:hypothetical protein Cob_v011728 [Colletotrichum orbiculare MAFF 240422]